MKLLLLYLVAVFLISVRGHRRGRSPRPWSLMVVALAVSAAYYTRGVL